MSKNKNARLDQYGAGPFEQQQFETAGVERVSTEIYRNAWRAPWRAQTDRQHFG